MTVKVPAGCLLLQAGKYKRVSYRNQNIRFFISHPTHSVCHSMHHSSHVVCLCLGKQFEYLTGGYILAGFHEVVVSPATVAAMDAAKAQNKSLWRISSTLFGHIAR